MSATTDRRRRYIPDEYREAIVVVGAVAGTGMIALGIVMSTLGSSLGFRGADVLTPLQRTLLTVAGIGIVVRGMARSVRAFEGLADDELRARLLGSLVVVPLVVAVVLGVADAGGASVATSIGFPFSWLASAVTGFLVAAVTNGAVEAAVVVVGRARPAVDAWVERLRTEGGTGRRVLAVALDGLASDGPLLVVLTGLFLFLLGTGAQRTFSAPFLRTMTDKLVLIAGGLLVGYLGWKTLRGAARVVGW